MEGNRRQFIFKSGLLLSGDDGVSEAEEEGRKEARKEDDSRAAMLPRQAQPAPNVTHSLTSPKTEKREMRVVRTRVSKGCRGRRRRLRF